MNKKINEEVKDEKVIIQYAEDSDGGNDTVEISSRDSALNVLRNLDDYSEATSGKFNYAEVFPGREKFNTLSDLAQYLKDHYDITDDEIQEDSEEELESDYYEDMKSEVYNALAEIYAKYNLKGAILKDLDSAVDFATIHMRDEFDESLKEEDGKYYVYLHSPAGTELICSGTKEECEKCKKEKDATWKTGYMWETELTDKPIKETHLWDSLKEDKEEEKKDDDKGDEDKEESKESKLETFDEKMDFLAKDEQEAIDGYDKILAMLDAEKDANAIEQLTHLKEEEIAHKDFLEVLKKDPEAIYSHEDEEGPKDDEFLNDTTMDAELDVVDIDNLDDVDDAFGESLIKEDVEDDIVKTVEIEVAGGFEDWTLEDYPEVKVASRRDEGNDEYVVLEGPRDDVEMYIYDNFDEDSFRGFDFFGDGDILFEDTIKKGNKWVNKGKDGEHGEFKTKKEADAQRKAMFANGYHEDYDDDFGFNHVLDESDDEELGTVDWNSLDDEEEPIKEDSHNTGHIKAKKPIELKARVEK